MKAIIVADGDVSLPAAGRDALLAGDADGPPLVIAADGGARKAAEHGLAPDIVVGDADSLEASELARLRDAGVEVHVLPAEKDESDTELALREALARGAAEIIILGAFGGRRIDHALASIALLALPELSGHDVTVRDGTTTIRLVGSRDGPGVASIRGARGDLVSLFPVDPAVEGISTTGLRYPLRDDALVLGPSRGLSNELTGPTAEVTTGRGRLLLVHTQGVEP